MRGFKLFHKGDSPKRWLPNVNPVNLVTNKGSGDENVSLNMCSIIIIPTTSLCIICPTVLPDTASLLGCTVASLTPP